MKSEWVEFGIEIENSAQYQTLDVQLHRHMHQLVRSSLESCLENFSICRYKLSIVALCNIHITMHGRLQYTVHIRSERNQWKIHFSKHSVQPHDINTNAVAAVDIYDYNGDIRNKNTFLVAPHTHATKHSMMWIHCQRYQLLKPSPLPPKNPQNEVVYWMYNQPGWKPCIIITRYGR